MDELVVKSVTIVNQMIYHQMMANAREGGGERMYLGTLEDRSSIFSWRKG